MVEAFVADLASGLVAKLISLASEEVIRAWKLEDNLQELRERLESISALLSDAGTKSVTMISFHNWLDKLEAVAHVADVLMDQLSFEVTRKKVENHRKVRNFFCPSKNAILYRFKVARKIKYINTSFDKIFKLAGDIGLKPVQLLSSIEKRTDICKTPSFEDESLIVGRENDVLNLVKMVCQNYEDDLPVIALVGMGGQGKTTLARIVYNSVDVSNIFDRNKMWVTVSDDFDFMRILNQMAESLTATNSALETPEGVIKSLQNKLKGKKFLLVLDDVWNEKSEEWDKLRNSLLGVGVGSRGSKILITTRNHEVIVALQTSLVYEVKGLSSNDSWKLFKNRAFARGGVSEDDTFEAIGRSLVERCGGLPLAIKSLGGLLYSKKSKAEWLSIRDSETWKSRNVLPSLRLSYDHLPYPSLKRCFAYFSILPKDSDINKDELVQIWIALGFLSSPRGSSFLMEDIGNEYFNILLWNSLLQDVKRDQFDNIIFCKMHDLVHDLALDLSKSQSAYVKANIELVHISKVRHLRLEGVEVIEKHIAKKNFERVQALYVNARVLGEMLPNLKNLSVLVISSTGVKEFPRSLDMLRYLKYLDISYFQEKCRLPNCIMELYNLQTLRIWDLLEVPNNFFKLMNLRHLVVVGAVDNRSYRLFGIEQLTSLQTLPALHVSGGDKKCHVGQLGKLNNLRGTVELYGLSDVKNMEEASKANLCGKSNLQCLKLDWRKEGDQLENGEYNDKDVMEGLKPHTNVEMLEIAYFKGKKFASWMVMMRNLVKIKLKQCNRSEAIPQLGHLPKLREIWIEGMENMKVIGKEYGNEIMSHTGDHEGASTSSSYLSEIVAAETTVTTMFQSCRKLFLRNMPKLEELLAEVKSTYHENHGTILAFPNLEVLHIYECPKLKRIPSTCFASLKELIIFNLNSSRIVETISKKLSSLTILRLDNVRGGGSSSTLTSSDMNCIVEELLRNNSASLRRIDIEECQGLTCMTIGNTSLALDKLYVRDCSDLCNISVSEESSCIKYLSIGGCPNLVSLSGLLHSQNLRSTLVSLSLGPLPEEVDELPWPFSSSLISFINLHSLCLRGWPKLKSVPPKQFLLHDDLSSTFPALKYLYLFNFNGLEALPDLLGKLSLLSLLDIQNCENLAILPAVENLQSIQTLSISGCPILQNRCRDENSPEWFKIQHILRVYI